VVNRSDKVDCAAKLIEKRPTPLGVTEICCVAQACRKFFELHATNDSQPAE
jgi:hypothetical protein